MGKKSRKTPGSSTSLMETSPEKKTREGNSNKINTYLQARYKPSTCGHFIPDDNQGALREANSEQHGYKTANNSISKDELERIRLARQSEAAFREAQQGVNSPANSTSTQHTPTPSPQSSVHQKQTPGGDITSGLAKMSSVPYFNTVSNILKIPELMEYTMLSYIQS